MKRFLTFLGAVVFLTIILFIAISGYAVHLCYALAPSARIYADQSVLAIITKWSEDELVERASPELRLNTSKGQLDQIFATFKELGTLQTYGGVHGRPTISYSTKEGIIVSATFRTTATFQRGKAEITIVLIRHNNAWLINGFHLDREPSYQM